VFFTGDLPESPFNFSSLTKPERGRGNTIIVGGSGRKKASEKNVP